MAQKELRIVEITMNGQKVGQTVKNMEADVRKYTAEWRNATTAAERAAAAAKLRGAKEALAEINKETKNIGRGMSSLKDTIAGVFGGNLLSNIGQKLLSIGKEAIAIGLEAEGVRKAFQRLNNPGLLSELRKATRGTVSDLNLMKAAVKFDNFHLPVKKLGSLLEFATQRARDTGESIDYLVESMVTGLARKSPLILDNLGLNVQEINKEFEKTGDFATAAGNIIEREMQKAGTSVDLAADKAGRWSARWQNFLAGLGDAAIRIGELGEGFVDYFKNLANGMETQSKSAKQQEYNNWLIATANKHIQENTKWINDNNLAGKDRDYFLKKNYESQAQIIKLSGKEKEEAERLTKVRYSDIKAMAELGYSYAQAELERRKGIKASKTTIEGLEKELSMLQEFQSKAEIGTDSYISNQKKIEAIEKQLSDARGKNADKDIKVQEEYHRNTQKLLDQARQANIDAIQDDRLRELENIKFKAEVDKKEIEKTKASAQSKADAIKAIDDKLAAETKEINDKHDTEDIKSLNDFLGERDKAMREMADKRAAEEQQAIDDRKKMLELEVELTEEHSQARLDAETNLLAFEMEQELTNTLLTEDQKALIRDKYREEMKDKEEEFWEEWGDKAGEKIGEVGGYALQFINDNEERRRNAQEEELRAAKHITDDKLKSLQEAYDSEKEKLEQQKENKVISATEYKNKAELLDKEYAKNKEATDKEYDDKAKAIARDQAAREKKIKIFEAIINTAAGITKAFPNPIMMALVGILGASSIATISSEPLPELAQGGYAVTGHSGRKYNATYRGNNYGYVSSPSLFIAGEAGREYVVPGGMMDDPVVANTVGWLETRRTRGVREFAQGGPVSSTAPRSQLPAVPDNTAFIQMIAENTAMIAQLKARLDNPAPATATISYDHQVRTDSDVSAAELNAGA